MEFPGGFMIGVDTYQTARCGEFAEVAGEIRAWLRQLPDEGMIAGGAGLGQDRRFLTLGA